MFCVRKYIPVTFQKHHHYLCYEARNMQFVQLLQLHILEVVLP